MRQIVFILVLVCLSLHSFCENDSKHPFFFNAFGISINRTNVQDENTANRYGYGFGIYHIGNKNKKVNFLLGFEYNRTYQYAGYAYEGHFAYGTDLTYATGIFSIPLGVRFNIQSKNKTIFFIETAISLDIMGVTAKETEHIDEPLQPSQVYDTTQSVGSAATLGFSLGIGFSIPISKYVIIIKPDCKIELGSIDLVYSQIYNSYFRLILQLKFP